MVAATLVVVALGTIAFAFRRGPADLQVSGKVSGTPTPTVQRPDAAGVTPAPTAFVASGSWTLSSLPGCFFERQRYTGLVDRVRSKFPPSATRIAPGTIVRAGDCTVIVRQRELWIERGADRLRVPPDAALYRQAGRYTLVYIHGKHAEVRRF